MSITQADASVLNLTNPGVTAKILGGSIDGTPIGSTTPASGDFTNVITPTINSFSANCPWVILRDQRPAGYSGGSTGQFNGTTMYPGWIMRSIGFGGWTPGIADDPYGLYSSGIVTLSQTGNATTNATSRYSTTPGGVGVADAMSYNFSITEAGTYVIETFGTGCSANNSRMGLFNVTNNEFVLYGANANGTSLGAVEISGTWTEVTNRVFDDSPIYGTITITNSTTYQLQTYTDGTGYMWDENPTGTGANMIDYSAFGTAINYNSIPELYMSVKITKIK